MAKKTVTIHISIPRKLDSRIKKLRQTNMINVSFVCTKALEEKIAELSEG